MSRLISFAGAQLRYGFIANGTELADRLHWSRRFGLDPQKVNMNKDVGEQSVVMIVDDDADYREVLSDLLTQEGYSVVCAGNGRDALDYLRNSIPSLIILDLMMPIMSGWEFLKLKKTDPRMDSIPVLLTTGSGFVENSDVVAVLHKPVDFMALINAVKQNYSPQVRS